MGDRTLGDDIEDHALGQMGISTGSAINDLGVRQGAEPGPTISPGPGWRKPKTPEQKEASFKWWMGILAALFGVTYLQSQGVFPDFETSGNSYLIAIGSTALVTVLIVRFVPYVAKLLGFVILGTIALMIYQCSTTP